LLRVNIVYFSKTAKLKSPTVSLLKSQMALSRTETAWYTYTAEKGKII